MDRIGLDREFGFAEPDAPVAALGLFRTLDATGNSGDRATTSGTVRELDPRVADADFGRGLFREPEPGVRIGCGSSEVVFQRRFLRHPEQMYSSVSDMALSPTHRK